MSSTRVPTGAFLLFIGIRWFPSIGSIWLFLGALFLLNDISESNPLNTGDAVNTLAYVAVYSAAAFWQRLVGEIVPEPYLDEVFHIPQAQAYCNGDYYVWDPKLTTPPGLYIFSTFFIQALGRLHCTVWNLRAFNTFALLATMAYACDCRRIVSRLWQQSAAHLKSSQNLHLPGVASSIDLHTTINVALFPPLFFFSGLYYTDVLSTCVVLLAFKSFLQRGDTGAISTLSSIWIYVVGLVALSMRQTNIFWVAAFMGGLEAVRAIKTTLKPVVKQAPQAQTWKEVAISSMQRYSQGQIHDVPLSDAEPQDFALCAISLAIAILYHPVLIMTRLWPYLALLLSFATFVIWNGGVVLGDKSNHVATIHLPQLLYLWPFITFFSWPLILPSARRFLSSSLSTIIFLIKPSPIPKFPTLRRLALPVLVTGISLLTTLVIIHFNTLIHPFTLADNRHYVFYVFRYTILRHPIIRYILAPIYIACFYLCNLTLSAPASTSPTPSLAIKSTPQRTAQQKRIIAAASASSKTPNSGSASPQEHGPSTSFFLIWLLSTSLSLITAPLVEPRYFIIPWVLWRLHIPSSVPAALQPALAVSERESLGATKGGEEDIDVTDGGNGQAEISPGEGYDVRLLAETAWFLLLNAVTGYAFLYKGFEWVSEPGLLQRFMW